MKNVNPFSLEFGVEPHECIERLAEINEIKEDFTSIIPSTHFYAILGPRGCGKSVLLSSIVDSFSSMEGWIAIGLNCKDNMLEQFAAKLYDQAKMQSHFVATEFSFSFSGLTFSIRGKEPVASLSVLLEKMLKTLDRHNQKILLYADDIANNDYVATFAKEFQSLRMKKAPIFFLTTGLYSTFNNLQTSDGLTFLQRARKIYLTPLNYKAIADSYADIFDISFDQAKSLTLLTKGYAFAYQCLGYLLVKEGETSASTNILRKYDYYLSEYVYSKLFLDLTEKERNIAYYLAINGDSDNTKLIEAGLVSDKTISVYKESLSKKGVLDVSTRGMNKLALPRFGEFVKFRMESFD